MRCSGVLTLAVLLTVPVGLPAAQAAPAVSWRPCPTEQAPTKECGWISVPRDYDRPGAGSLRIAVARIPATGPRAQRIGSLVWDAGGPGGVSTEMVDTIVARMSGQVRARFDFVAFDPRGIGASTPALRDCAQPWPLRPGWTPLPSWRNAVQRSGSALGAANRQCLTANRRIATVMGTAHVAQDLDRIRAALGDRQLTFWATSYGTRIGYVYALRYPQRVRAMVLDGSIDPSQGYAGLPAVGGTSQEKALNFIRRHDRPVYRSVIRTAAALTAAPVDLGGGQRFDRWDWLDVVADVVAFQDAWVAIPTYADVVDRARSGDDRARAALIAAKARPNSNEGGGFSVVNCLDYADRLTPKEQVAVTRRNARRAPVLGGSLTLAFAVGCRGLGHLDPDPIPLVTTAAQRARLAQVPAVLANSTQDGSTPMAWAQQMRRAFAAPMIRYRSTQHVIWGATASDCVNRPLDRFVLHTWIPKRSRTCRFVPSPAAATTSLH